jgi:tyrosine aminotransferase
LVHFLTTATLITHHSSPTTFSIYGSLHAIRAGAQRLAQVVLGASHLAQAAVPALLDPSNAPAVHEWQTRLRRQLQQQAETLTTRLSAIPGLECGPAQGALYLMVRLRNDVDDVEFCQRLLQEQNVLVLPGQCFGAPHYVRMVFCAPVSVLEEAADRIQIFCQKYYQPTEESDGPPDCTLVDE